MMVWPDGGIGMPHQHPFWKKCTRCPAAAGWAQEVAMLVYYLIMTGSVFVLLGYVIKGAL